MEWVPSTGAICERMPEADVPLIEGPYDVADTPFSDSTRYSVDWAWSGISGAVGRRVIARLFHLVKIGHYRGARRPIPADHRSVANHAITITLRIADNGQFLDPIGKKKAGNLPGPQATRPAQTPEHPTISPLLTSLFK